VNTVFAIRTPWSGIGIEHGYCKVRHPAHPPGTDVLVDIALDQRPHSGPASKLLDRIEYGAEAAYVAWHSISNSHYIVAPGRGGLRTRDFIVELTRFVAMALANTEDIHYAAVLPRADFEDAARACGAQHSVCARRWISAVHPLSNEWHGRGIPCRFTMKRGYRVR